MKKMILTLVALMGFTCASQAGINVQWFVAFGMYPFGAPDPTDFTPGTGLLANNVTGNTLFQLVFAGSDNLADIVDPSNSGGGYVSDDDVVLDSRVIVDGADGYDEWMFNNVIPTPYTDAVFTPGSVYARVFHDATPSSGEFYFDSSLLVLSDESLDIAFTQALSPDDSAGGRALNLTIVPEPSSLVLAGAGVLLVMLRRKMKK